MNKIRLPIFLVSFFLVQHLQSQQLEIVKVAPEKMMAGPYLRFDKIGFGNNNYKKASEKSVLLQDKQGYLWLKSANGNNEELTRYDGNYTKSFKGKRLGIFQAKDGSILGNNEERIMVFDPKTETFKNYTNPFLEDSGIDRNIVGNDGEMWFTQLHKKYADRVTPMPFFRFDYKKQQFIRFMPKYVIDGYSGKNKTFSYKQFNPLLVAPNGFIWGTFDIKEHYPSSMIGYFNPKTLKCVGFPLPSLSVPELSDVKYENAFSFMHNAFIDDKYLWLGHTWWQAGLLRFDLKSHQWKQFLFPLINANRIGKIAFKNQNELWIRNNEYGLMIFNKNNGMSAYYYNDRTNQDFLLNTNIGNFISGHGGNLWFGIASAINDNSIYFLDTQKQYFNQNQPQSPERNGFFRALYKNKTKIIYTYRTNDKIKIEAYHYQSKTTKKLWQYNVGKLTDQQIYTALEDTVNHKIWIIGEIVNGGAIMRLDDKNGTVTHVKAKINGLPNGKNETELITEIRAICQDPAGDVWFASFGTLIKFDHLSQQFEGFEEGKNGLFQDNRIRNLMADANGIIWVGCRSGEILWFDPKTKMATKQKVGGQFAGDVNKIIEDKARKLVWIAKYDSGLIKYDQRTGIYSQVPEIPDMFNMHLTNDGILWIRTPSNIVRYNPDTKETVKFGAEYGFTNFDWTPFTKTKDDAFFFGKFKFTHQDIKPDITKPKAVFSFVKVFDNELQLTENLNSINKIELKNSQNFFSVGFSILSYFNKEANQFAYQLVGFNKDWVNVGNLPLATFTNVPPGEYQLKIKGANQNEIWSDERILKIVVLPAYWQTWWFKVFCLLLLAGAIYSIYQYQLREKLLKSKLKAEEALRKQREAELQQRISQTEISALRAQMNPHFIFNCLNSIQYFAARNDADSASEYLSKFSRLIRLVLENSRSEKVTLHNELETLRLYIEMEAMRFRDKFSYAINMNQEIDSEQIQIPPLLLQPFVENSIWHGLMHKEEGGSVRIDVTQPTEQLLRVEITDDGIGRAQAAEYKSKSATSNKSFGMKVTAERIELINQLYNTTAKVQIVDLKNQIGEAIGTKVVVEIPI